MRREGGLLSLTAVLSRTMLVVVTGLPVVKTGELFVSSHRVGHAGGAWRGLVNQTPDRRLGAGLD